MKKKILVAAAAFGTVCILTLFGTQAVKTVFAAEERIRISETDTVNGLKGGSDEEVLKVYKHDIYHDEGVTVVLPADYIPSDTQKGRYLAKRHPLDSSNIYYTVTKGNDTAALRSSIQAEDYKAAAEKKFVEAYGTGAKITQYNFQETTVDGCPAYKIALSCTVDGMTMDQLILMIVADNTYTITYSQSSDDERMEAFEKSLGTVHVVFK